MGAIQAAINKLYREETTDAAARRMRLLRRQSAASPRSVGKRRAFLFKS